MDVPKPSRSAEPGYSGRSTARKLATIGETAISLNVSDRSVRRRIAEGHIRVVRIGRSVRIPIAEIDRLIQRALDESAKRPSDSEGA